MVSHKPAALHCGHFSPSVANRLVRGELVHLIASTGSPGTDRSSGEAQTSHLLVVEDDPLSLRIIQGLLVVQGFTSDAAPSGIQALQSLDRPFDGVIINLNIADVDGIRLLKHVSAKLNVPVIIVSEFRSEEEKIAAWDGGAADVIVKPFVPAELLARIRAALRRHSGAPWSGAADGRRVQPSRF